MAATSYFCNLQLAPPIEVFELTAKFNEDKCEKKVNLGVGAYRTEESKPWVLPVVRHVESQLAADHTLNHEYLPVAGLPEYRTGAARLLLGENSAAIQENRVDAIQSVGGTGAVFMGMSMLRNKMGYDTIYVSKPTWGNHIGIAKLLHYPNVCEYRYWNAQQRCIDFDGMIEDMQNAPCGSVFLLHMCAHNPTGMDPTMDQWHKISHVIRDKNHFPFFDCAYQGFSSGDLAKDAAPVRFFVEAGFEIFAAQSFSKNFGLYNERVGQLLFVTNNKDLVPTVRSQLVLIVRETWSNPPSHGGRIVATVLNNPALYREWLDCVKTMADRIILMRQLLFQKLKALGTPGTWDHIVQQTGMFSYTGLNAQQSEYLIQTYHIYLLRDGRINMCGVTSQNVDYVAGAIDSAVRNIHG